MKTNQRGFGVIEILVIVLIIGLMATIGWLVYDRQNNASKTSDNSNQSTSQKKSPDDEKQPELTTTTLKTFSISYDSSWKVTQQISENGPCSDGLMYEKLELEKGQKDISIVVNECGKDAASDVVVDYVVNDGRVTIPNKNLSVCKPDPAYEMDFCSSGDGQLIAIGGIGTDDGLKNHYFIEFTDDASEDVSLSNLADIYKALESIKLVQ